MDLKDLKEKAINLPHGEYRLAVPVPVVDEGTFIALLTRTSSIYTRSWYLEKTTVVWKSIWHKNSDIRGCSMLIEINGKVASVRNRSKNKPDMMTVMSIYVNCCPYIRSRMRPVQSWWQKK